jgi:hypothetical protein
MKFGSGGRTHGNPHERRQPSPVARGRETTTTKEACLRFASVGAVAASVTKTNADRQTHQHNKTNQQHQCDPHRQTKEATQ